MVIFILFVFIEKWTINNTTIELNALSPNCGVHFNQPLYIIKKENIQHVKDYITTMEGNTLKFKTKSNKYC